uniref:Leucine-rich repeat-containing N-terminal plant-type domain-containing protein n=1 Tax=Solanum lycopersicum TaxID=4081 RepID=A0A3Q7JFR7_SOLLC
MGSGQFSFLLFPCFCLLSFSSSIPHPCRKDQCSALLKFKKMLTVDTSLVCCSYTSTWNMSRYCCSWDGVVCNDMTGFVTELDLSLFRDESLNLSNSSLHMLEEYQGP